MKKFKTLITIILIAFILIQTSCYKGNGPFHRQAFIKTPDVICETSKGKYCNLNREIYEIIDGTFIKKEIKFDKKNQAGMTNLLEDIISDNDLIYVQTSYYVYVFNSSWVLEKRLDLSTICILVNDNYLYYTTGNSPFNMLNVYDLNTNEITEINIKDNRVININETTLFVNNEGRIFKINDDNNNKYLAESYNVYDKHLKMNFVINNNEYLFAFENGFLNVHNNDNYNQYDIKNCNMYYRNFFTKGEKVYFATYEFLKNDECNEHARCICHFGKSYIWCFDVNSNTLELVKEFNEGSYVINFSEEQYCYYNDGKIYLNDSILKEIEKITTGELYFSRHSTYTSAEEKSNTFFYYDEELYYLHIDYTYE